MSESQHPVAARLERLVGGQTILLATVMLLPLVDGIFPALVLAGAMDTYAGILQVGILVFGGSATLAVILAELDGGRRDHVATVLAVGVPLVLLAAIEAALAPAIAEVIDLATFERFAALVIATIAAKTASARVGEYLPRPAVIVGLGFLASVDPTGLASPEQLSVAVDVQAVTHGVAAGAVGVGFALLVAVLAPRLRANVAIERFRFGSAVALGLLALSILGFPYGRAPLAVIAVTGVFAFDPGGGLSGQDQEPTSAVDGGEAAPTTQDNACVTDGGAPDCADDSASAPGSDGEAVEANLDGDHPPWL